MTSLDIIVLLTYFAVMIGIGLWAMRRVKGQDDYFMGGRGFGKIMQTFAAFGAGTGAHEPVTVGRTGWTSGLSGVWSALMWLFVTPIYWFTAVWYRRMRHLTLGDWFVERYESKGLGAAYTLFAIVFYMFYLSTMLSAIAKFSVPLMDVETIWGYELRFVLIPAIAGIVIIYGVLGGLTAAYYTDLIQGVFIILLSVLLIPYGLWALVEKFGDPQTQGIMDGFTIMHERVSADYFNLFGGPSAGEFPVQYIVSLTILALVGIVVQPHFIATGGGSAKSESEARIGLVVGNLLKRLCTAGWAITALIALALLAGNTEIAGDPDKVWGVAAREILGPLNMGLVGLMLACLLAAMMSSADAYMIVTSALVVRNVYAAYVNPNASDAECVRAGRISGLIIIVGASIVAMAYSDVFGQFKMAIELPLLFAAPFWLGMVWRRVNRKAVWLTVGFVATVFFFLPVALPIMRGEGMRTNPAFTQTTRIETRTMTRTATAADVASSEAKLELWQKAVDARVDDDSSNTSSPKPTIPAVGDDIEVVARTGGVPIFWAGVEPVGEAQLETIADTTSDDGVHLLVQRRTGPMIGKGNFKIDFLPYHLMGVDLANQSKATLETLRLPPRVLIPFLILIFASYITPRNSKWCLDRYFAKMKTEVDPDPETDRKNLQESYDDPTRFDHRKLFPKTEWEMLKPQKNDIVGFLLASVACVLIIVGLVWVASIGS